MATARGIIESSLRKIGALTKFDTLSADEANDGLEVLNQMLGAWSNDGLIVYARAWESFTINANDGQYSIGTGGDFNTSRPLHILDAYVRQDITDYPLEILTDGDYNVKIADKSSSGIPDYLNYDTQFPTANIRLWPVPSSTMSLFILSEKPFNSYALDDTVTLPSGYDLAIIYNLAMYLAPEYGQPITGELLKIAGDSLASIKTANMRNRPIKWQPGPLGSYNILSGWA